MIASERPLTWLGFANLPGVRIQKNERLANLFLILGAALLGLQLFFIHRSVLDSTLAQKSPVSYSQPWHPERTVYHPGDSVLFTYLRESKEVPLLLLLVDSFERVETSELYPGAILGRVVDKPGQWDQRSVRVLPLAMRPGHYRLVGWVSAQTARRSQPASYTSEVFEVRP